MLHLHTVCLFSRALNTIKGLPWFKMYDCSTAFDSTGMFTVTASQNSLKRPEASPKHCVLEKGGMIKDIVVLSLYLILNKS